MFRIIRKHKLPSLTHGIATTSEEAFPVSSRVADVVEVETVDEDVVVDEEGLAEGDLLDEGREKRWWWENERLFPDWDLEFPAPLIVGGHLGVGIAWWRKKKGWEDPTLLPPRCFSPPPLIQPRGKRLVVDERDARGRSSGTGTEIGIETPPCLPPPSTVGAEDEVDNRWEPFPCSNEYPTTCGCKANTIVLSSKVMKSKEKINLKQTVYVKGCKPLPHTYLGLKPIGCLRRRSSKGTPGLSAEIPSPQGITPSSSRKWCITCGSHSICYHIWRKPTKKTMPIWQNACDTGMQKGW